ncbi:MAG TPA: NAD(P)-dependent oxidoreductase [Blastocatellia bacterium]|nr:NAD(P)-dependent oxidoreductase [Blastocatellia bacterium]
MKILIADKFPATGVAELQSIGCDVVVDADLKEDALVAAVRDTGADVLIVRSTKVTEPMLDAGNLRLVIRAGAGYNTIDVKAASVRGIYVSNCPGKNAVAVAELAFGLMLSLDRRIADNVADIRRGVWNKKEYGKARGLYGRTLGLIGLGRIGQEMIPRAKAFGMNVVGWSRPMTYARAAEMGITLFEEPEEVAEAADVLSVHLSLNDGTRGKIGESIIGAMRPGTILINTSRAEIVDQAVLERAIAEKGIRAGLDVFDGEPATGTADVNVPIAALAGVYVTHHIGASTDQAQDAIANETLRIVREYKESGRVPNVVNLAERTPATHMIVVRHRDRVGVLAHVLNALRTAGINVQEMENIVFDGAEAAIARIHLDAAPSDDLLAIICDNEHVLATEVLNLT